MSLDLEHDLEDYVDDEDDDTRDEADERGPAPAGRGRLTPVLALVTLALVVLAAVQGLALRSASQADRESAAATRAARAAVPAVLSYDYRHLDADFARARTYLTGSFATQFDGVATGTVAPVATERQVVTSAAVTGSSVVTRSGDTVVVLLFVNQTTSALPEKTSEKTGGKAGGKAGEKSLAQQSLDLSRVRVTMQRAGGDWRVADLRGV
ncbi:hypothetical protein ACIB24_21775 [Spongisporangium articulatum]|uniref:Mce-associated membrane protein n=1 Tax=Spongisporangium articulatum TaxID=3362603 RepID=A0ABW8ATJ1_9ACTN